MPKWQYCNPVKIHFGTGIIKNLLALIGCRNTILITTPGFSERGTTDLLRKLLGNSLVAIFDEVLPNSTFTSVKAAVSHLQRFKYDNIIALGGGSAIDTAKAVAAIDASGNKNWLDDHLKQGIPFPKEFNPKPIIAIPTTAGTGSEVTMWATVWDMEEKKKYSIEHPLLYPQKAILDPELTLTLPEEETTYSGLDAFSHAMESIWNKNHNPISDTFALEAISLIYDYLPELRNDLTNSVLRIYMLRASLFAGLAFSNTKTGLAHSISYPLTAHFGLPHGLACALPLPHILRFNALKSAKRIKIMAKAFKTDTKAKSMILEVTKLFERIGLSLSLSDYGINIDQAELISSLAYTSGRADNNITSFSEDDVMDIIHSLFKFRII